MGFGYIVMNDSDEVTLLETSGPHSLVDFTPTIKDTRVFALNYVKPIGDIDIDAKAAILVNAETGEVLFEKNSDESLPIASMSKMMSALLILEAIEKGVIMWDDEVPISDYAYTVSHREPFSSILLDKETTYTVQELFEAMMVSSANDATIALAEIISGSEKEFVKEMNERATKLSFAGAYFVDSTGLGNMNLFDLFTTGSINDVNVMTARELSELATILIDRFPHLLDITQTISYESGEETYYNTNWMLVGNNEESMEELNIDLGYQGIEGLKTGYTNASGYCFTGTVVIEEVRYISVIMGTEDVEDRFIESEKLYEGISKQLNP